MINKSTKYYNEKISYLRKDGQFDEAISVCNQAINDYPENNFYFKVKGDILLQTCKYDLSLEAYFGYLVRINDRYDLLKGFIHFFEKLIEKDNANEQRYKNILFNKINDSMFSITITEWLLAFLRTKITITDDMDQILFYSDNDKYFNKFVREIQFLEKGNRNADLLIIFDHCKKRTSRDSTQGTDKYIISVLEKNKRYKDALYISMDLLNTNDDSTLIRTIFRIGRNIKD